MRLPELAEPQALVAVCKRPDALVRLQHLLTAARAEESAAGEKPSPRLVDRTVATAVGLPVVGEFRDWTRLGVHRPISRERRAEPVFP